MLYSVYCSMQVCLGGWFLSTILSLKLLKRTDLNNSIGDFVNRGNMIHSKVGEGSRRIARSCKLHLHTILIFSLYTHCVQTMYNVCSTYKYLSISTSTLGNLRKYLSKVQVLSNLYLSVLKYKYSCTWPHVWLQLHITHKIK